MQTRLTMKQDIWTMARMNVLQMRRVQLQDDEGMEKNAASRQAYQELNDKLLDEVRAEVRRIQERRAR